MELRVTASARGLNGTIRVPGDKSITHRALLFGAMADGTTRLSGPLRAGVIEAMEDCLGALGVEIERAQANETLVGGIRWQTPDRLLDCRNSAATMRLLMGALAASPVRATLTGSARLSERPMTRVADPLRRMGAQISGPNGHDGPPLSIVGSRLRGIEYRMPVPSAQVKTAILAAGLQAKGRTLIYEPVPTRDHSERLLAGLGIPLTSSNGALRLDPRSSRLPPFDLVIPGDFSAAAFPLAAAVLTPGSELTIRGVGINPTRTGLLEVLGEMGARIEIARTAATEIEPSGDLTARYSDLRGITIQGDRMASMIDEFPILAVIATQAYGETRVLEAGELRLKESDRLASMTVELRKMGARIEQHAGGATIEGPTRLTGARVDSHGDHRVGLALAVAGGLASGETILSGAEVIRESFPEFAATLRSVGGQLE
jgi:3-phosphoshikimate 1-carboxyvinyltransferase